MAQPGTNVLSTSRWDPHLLARARARDPKGVVATVERLGKQHRSLVEKRRVDQASKRRRTHDEDNRQVVIITFASEPPALCAVHTGVRHEAGLCDDMVVGAGVQPILIPRTLPAVRSSSLESLSPLPASCSTDSPHAIAVQVTAANPLKRAANPLCLPRAKVKPKVQPPLGVKRALVFSPGPRLRLKLSKLQLVVPISNHSLFPNIKGK